MAAGLCRVGGESLWWFVVAGTAGVGVASRAPSYGGGVVVDQNVTVNQLMFAGETLFGYEFAQTIR